MLNLTNLCWKILSCVERAPSEVTQGNEIQDLESVKMLQLVIATVNLH